MVVEQLSFRVRRGREADFEKDRQALHAALRRAQGFVTLAWYRGVENAAEQVAEIRWASRDYRDRFAATDDKETVALRARAAERLEAPPAARLLEPI
ncbi:MAG: antibiotic biosynthesis monooxygenase [Candidatus Polarisedimenticolia bacterium]